MKNIQWGKWAAVAVCLAAGVIGVMLIFRYVLPIFAPFLVAFAISLLIRPLAQVFSARTHLSYKVCAALFLTLFLIGTGFLMGVVMQRLLLELEDLLTRLLSEGGDFSGLIQSSVDFFDTVTSKIGFLRRIGAGERFGALREAFNEMVANLLGDLLRSLTAAIPTWIGRVVASLPTIFLAGVVAVIAAFYFCMGGERIGRSLCAYLPRGIRTRLPQWKANAKQMSVRYLRAYFLLWLLTLCQLFLGFAILRVKYAFLLALVVSFVDLLPILGVGTVLIPWAVVLLIQHQYGTAIGLLVLYLTVTVLRQVLEPKLVGKSLGISPLLALFATYAGWQLLGFWGMIIAPFAAMIVKAIVEQRRGAI